MQFKININITDATPDIDAIEQAIGTVDPSALVDIDPAGRTLRVAAAIDAAQLLGLISRAGYPVTTDQLELVPSECCGGCGG
jgi:hypothetical protein